MHALTSERAVDALLDVSAPRCVWHRGRLFVNEPFASAFGITRESDSSVQSSQLTRSGELVEALVAGCHVDIDVEQGQVAIVPVRIADDTFVVGDLRARVLRAVLRDVLRALSDAAEDAGALGNLCRMLVDLPGRMFETVTILRSRPFEPFLFVERYGDRRKIDRWWGRWPFHRLFLRRRAVLIQHPLLLDRALAFPFLHDGVRSVILATLARERLAPQEDELVTVLQSVSLAPEALGADIGPTDDPMFLWFGTDRNVRERFEGILQRRGWRLRTCERFSDFRRDTYAHGFPVLCIDAGLRNAAYAVRMLRSGEAATLAIVAIGSLDMPGEEASALVDECITLESSDREIIAALKHALRRSTAARIGEFKADLEKAKALIRSTKSVDDLANEAARTAALLIEGWANVQLMDPSGLISLGEYPVSPRPVASDIPNFFLDATPLVKVAVDDEFFEYASSDETARRRMRALDFKSGVCIPLSDGQRIAGTLIAASTKLRRDENELKGVISLSQEIVAQLRRIRERPALPEFHREKSWTYLRDTSTEVHVYHSPDAAMAARFFRIDAAFSVLLIAEPRYHEAIVTVLLEMDLPATEPGVILARLMDARIEGAFLLATIDRAARALSFAGRGVSAPVLWNAPGPHGELASVGDAFIGTFSLERSRAAYFSDMALTPYAHRSLAEIRVDLEKNAPAGIFAAVVMHSLAAG